MKNKKFTVGGLFSGVGGIELAFERAGFEISWANEFDKNACKTYKLNHPNHNLIEEDIYNLDPKKMKSVDSKEHCILITYFIKELIRKIGPARPGMPRKFKNS